MYTTHEAATLLGKKIIATAKPVSYTQLTMMKKILVPFDGSETALRALEFAAGIGKPFGSEIMVVNVIVPDVYKRQVRGRFQGITAFTRREYVY